MAIEWIRWTLTRSLKKDTSPLRTATRQALIKTTTANESLPDLLSDDASLGHTATLPQLGDEHPDDNVLILQDVEIRPNLSSMFLHEGTFNYSSRIPGEPIGDDDNPVNPEDQPPTLTWGFQTTTEDVFQEVEGAISPLPENPWLSEAIAKNLIVNTAGDRYEPLPQREVSRLSLSVSFLARDISSLSVVGEINNTNKTSWNGFEPETLRVTDISGSFEQFNGEIVNRVNYTLLHEPKTWRLVLLNRGRQRRIKNSKGQDVLIVIKDDENTPMEKPQELDLQGVPIYANPENPKEAIFFSYQIYETVDFNQIFPPLS